MNHPLRIYLDNCCYNRPYDDQSKIRIRIETQAKLYIQQLIRDNKLKLASSFILRYENSGNSRMDKRVSINRFISKHTHIYVNDTNKEQLLKKAKLIMQTGIKKADALHVACAISAHCDYFLTTDKRLLKYSSGEITLLNPLQFVELWEVHHEQQH
jgi:predicted nucleic acid-binding protein